MNRPLMSVAEALERVLAQAHPLPGVAMPLSEALGCVLIEDLTALRTQPPAAVSAMDGYAVRAADVAQAPVTLILIGEVAAGHPFDSEVIAGQAARIFTGGLMPAGTDTVVVQEIATRDGDRVTFRKPTAKGRNVRLEGIDFRRDQVLLRKGRWLNDRDLMLAAAMNHARLNVHRRPRVGVLGTGDELVAPGSNPGRGEVVYSNGFALMALARAENAEVMDLGVARDRLEEIVAAIRRARAPSAQSHWSTQPHPDPDCYRERLVRRRCRAPQLSAAGARSSARGS